MKTAAVYMPADALLLLVLVEEENGRRGWDNCEGRVSILGEPIEYGRRVGRNVLKMERLASMIEL